jgi:hypothetical protein
MEIIFYKTTPADRQTPPLLANEGTGEVNYTTPEKSHTGEK